MNIVGPKVRQLRKSQGLTQEVFAARCNLVGFNISRCILAKIESQSRRITDQEATLLVKALGVTINELYS